MAHRCLVAVFLWYECDQFKVKSGGLSFNHRLPETLLQPEPLGAWAAFGGVEGPPLRDRVVDVNAWRQAGAGGGGTRERVSGTEEYFFQKKRGKE